MKRKLENRVSVQQSGNVYERMFMSQGKLIFCRIYEVQLAHDMKHDDVRTITVFNLKTKEKLPTVL